jgi:ABC-type uncharacterized transport system permease subunit
MDLVFTTLFQEVCQKFNISVPILGTYDGSAGANGTLSPPSGNTTTTANGSSSAVPSPFVGSAGRLSGSTQSMWTISAGLGLIAILGFLL